jgi:hypothetical protein
MSKRQAHDELGKIIAQKTGGTTQPRADERIVTLAWFTRNRFFPLREGSTWKEETAAIRKIEIEQDILKLLGDLPLGQIDKVMLQIHLNDLAKKLSQGRVQHARFYLKAIFEEAIEQEFIAKNPARKLIPPNHLRASDTELGSTASGTSVGAAQGPHPADTGHDRDVSPQRIVRAAVERLQHRCTHARGDPDRLQRQTARLWKDQEVAAEGAPSRRAGERTVAVEAGVSRSLAASLHLSQCPQAQWGQEERLHWHRQLPRPC